MAEQDNNTPPIESDGDVTPPKSNLKLIIMIVVGVLVLAGGGFGAYLFFFKKDDKVAELVEEAPPKIEEIVVVDFPEILVNLKGRDKKRRFLKAKFLFELAKAEDKPQIERLTPRITDAFQVYLRELRIEDVEGPAGLDRVREEMLHRLNKITRPIKVHNILFHQFLIQ